MRSHAYFQNPRRLVATAFLITFAGCGGGGDGGGGGGGVTPPPPTRVPASVTFEGGGTVSGRVGSSAGTIVVLVRTSDNLPVPRVTVNFSASSGSVGSASAQTDDNGRASAGTWTLGTTAGTQTLTATAGSASAQLVATVAAGDPATIEIVTGIPATVQAGVPITPAPAVRTKDQFGNVVNRAGTVVTAVLLSGAGDLTGAQATTAASGLATFSALAINGLVSGGTRTIAFTSQGLPQVSAQPTALEAGPAFKLTLENIPTSARAGVVISPPISVVLADRFDNPISRPTAVVATVAQGGGTLSGSASTTDNTGRATFVSLAIEGLVGTRQLRFTAGQAAATSSSIALSAGDPSELRVTTQPTVVENTLAFPSNVIVRVTDRFGNGTPVSGLTVAAAIATGGGALLGNLASQTDAVGLATFSGLRLVGSAGVRTLVFTTTGLGPAMSAPISLEAGPPRFIAFFQQPSGSVTSGVPWAQQPALQLADTSGNVVRKPGTLVRATLLDATGELINDVALTDAGGVARFEQLTFLSATAFPPPTLRLRFSSGALASLVSGSIAIQSPAGTGVQSVAYGATSQRLFVLDPGASLVITATARDLVGNPLPSAPIVYNSMNSGVATVRPTGTITGVASGSAWVRALASGAPSVRDSLFITVPRDPTAPIVSTTQIAPIPVRNGVTSAFDVVLDTRDATIGAATILVAMPPELVNNISWQGSTGTIIGFDKGFNLLRISLVASSGLKGIFAIARVTVVSAAPVAHVTNREVVITPLEMFDVNLVDLSSRSTGVSIPLIP